MATPVVASNVPVTVSDLLTIPGSGVNVTINEGSTLSAADAPPPPPALDATWFDVPWSVVETLDESFLHEEKAVKNNMAAMPPSFKDFIRSVFLFEKMLTEFQRSLRIAEVTRISCKDILFHRYGK